MIVAALLVVPAIALEQSSAGEPWDTVATVLNWAIWTAFAAELATMLAVVPDRGRYLREHPLDVAIVLLTPPFLPASLQAARAFRLLRLLRLVRTGAAVRRLFSAENARDAGVLTMMLVLSGGAAFARKSSTCRLGMAFGGRSRRSRPSATETSARKRPRAAFWPSR